MKIAILNYATRVGKTTLAKFILSEVLPKPYRYLNLRYDKVRFHDHKGKAVLNPSLEDVVIDVEAEVLTAMPDYQLHELLGDCHCYIVPFCQTSDSLFHALRTMQTIEHLSEGSKNFTILPIFNCYPKYMSDSVEKQITAFRAMVNTMCQSEHLLHGKVKDFLHFYDDPYFIYPEEVRRLNPRIEALSQMARLTKNKSVQETLDFFKTENFNEVERQKIQLVKALLCVKNGEGSVDEVPVKDAINEEDIPF